MIDRAAYPWPGRFIDLPAGGMHYLDEGAGEPVLFVHGTPTWSFEWRHLIHALAPSHRCLAPDLLGFGLSDRPRSFAYTPEAHAKALADFVDRVDPPPFTLVVHDYGGPIGLPIGLDHPARVSRVVLINTWMWSFEGDRDMLWKARLAGGRLGRFLYRRLNFSLRAILPTAFGDRRKLTPEIHRHYLERFPDPWSRGAVLWPLARALVSSSRYYESLWARRELLRGVPTLIIWGMKDPAFTPRALRRWEEALPTAHVVRLDRAGHWPHEEEPETVVAALRQFFAHAP